MNLTRSTFLRSGLAGAALLAAPGILRAQPKVIRFATEAAFPPFNQSTPSGQIVGFEPDLVAALSERAGFEYELIAQAWDGMIQGLIDGKYDAVVDAVTITPKRLEVIDFSLPYTTGGSTFLTMNEAGLTLESNGTQVDLEDTAATEAAVAGIADALDGKVVAVQVATIQSDFLETYIAPLGATIRTYQSGQDAFQDLTNGRADLMMSSVTNLTAFLKKNPESISMNGPIFTGGIMGRGAAIAVRKGDTERQALFDTALKAMSDDGSLAEMSAKWFGINVSPKL